MIATSKDWNLHYSEPTQGELESPREEDTA